MRSSSWRKVLPVYIVPVGSINIIVFAAFGLLGCFVGNKNDKWAVYEAKMVDFYWNKSLKFFVNFLLLCNLYKKYLFLVFRMIMD